MKIKFIVLAVLVALLSALFIPFNQQLTITVESPFLKTYTALLNPQSWENWRPDINRAFHADSDKVTVRKKNNSFSINTPDIELNIRPAGNMFYIKERNYYDNFAYNYIVVPDKAADKTVMVINYRGSMIAYLFNKADKALAGAQAEKFKRFMETDSLYYGYKATKIKVPGSNLIELSRLVVAKDKFVTAKVMMAQLQTYVKAHNIKQLQPVIAQYIPKGTDSTQVNVGLFVNQEVSAGHAVVFVKMPEHGKLLAVNYKGRFSERAKVYAAMQKYFTDHAYQSAILPFETYLNNKLPDADTDQVNIQINFSTFL